MKLISINNLQLNFNTQSEYSRFRKLNHLYLMIDTVPPVQELEPDYYNLLNPACQIVQTTDVQSQLEIPRPCKHGLLGTLEQGQVQASGYCFDFVPGDYPLFIKNQSMQKVGIRKPHTIWGNVNYDLYHEFVSDLETQTLTYLKSHYNPNLYTL